MIFLLLVVIWWSDVCIGTFPPSPSDYNAYGLKMAANEIMLVEAQGDYEYSQFFVQFAPYNYTPQYRLQCTITYNDSTHYVYSVGIGTKQNSSQAYFFYAGEVIPSGSSTTDSSNNTGSFIGIVINTDPQSAQSYANQDDYVRCDLIEFETPYFFTSYDHQEFYVFGVDPYGQYAIGLTEYFVFIYRPFSNDSITLKNSSSVWPTDISFLPMAAKTGISYTITAGFFMNNSNYQASAIPSVYIISNSDLTVLTYWPYTAPKNSWQSWQSYNYYEIESEWSDKYTMSIDINFADETQVLVGMPFINTVFLFIVSHNGTNLTLVSSKDEGEAEGFGKSVAWLSASQIAILYPAYSRDQVTWYFTNINMYTLLNNATLPSSQPVVFPNIFQQLPSVMNSQLIRMISTPSSLATFDVNGYIILLLPELPGFYASTDTANSPYDGFIPIFSYSAPCLAGTFKADTSIQPCFPCSNGSRNPGITPMAQCIPCSPSGFCPSGAVIEVDKTLLLRQSQAYAYPRSPEITLFDDILLINIFSIGSTNRCIVISPLFWVLITIGLVAIVLFVMSILRWCIRTPQSTRYRIMLEKIFQHTDLIGEGELWAGGLVSFGIVVLLIFTYVFSAAFYQQYPIEKVGPSTFACDETLRNAQFDSSLQSLAVPVSEEEQPMFDLLDNQDFSMNIQLLNTVATCANLSADQIIGSSTENWTISHCVDSNGILSASLNLQSYHALTIRWTLNDIQPIGAVRVGLEGPGSEGEIYTLKELNFSQTFYDKNGGTLAQTIAIDLELTKAINETEPLANGETEFSGIWYPTFVVDQYQMFVTPEEYFASDQTSITVTITISEASYYIKNRQYPIAKQTEIIFHDLLLTIVVLEIFGLVFLIFKLALIPLVKTITKCFSKKEDNVSTSMAREISYQEKSTHNLDDIDLHF